MSAIKALKAILCILFLAGSVSIAGADSFHVYPKGKISIPEDAMSGFTNWNRLPQPGDIIYLYSDFGPFRENMNLFGLNGTMEKPIIIRSVSGVQPVIEGSVAFFNSSYISLENIEIKTGNKHDAAVQIRQKSNNITVRNCTIKNSGVGVWIGDGAGMQNIITDNIIHDNEIFGVVADKVNCRKDQETIIGKNRVYNNGSHGIEINANYYIIEGNEVYNNGGKQIGTSGIHLYSLNPGQNTGDNNIIRYNISHSNVELNGPDGNGIQLDQWCDGNQVYYNLCYSNDGAGIHLYDSSNNIIANNTLLSNVRDPGSSHHHKGEIALASDYHNKTDRTNNVQVINNLIVAYSSSAYAIFVDKLTSDNTLKIRNNIFHHRNRKMFYFWDDKAGKSISRFNSLPGCSNNSASDPMLTSYSPEQISDFIPQKGSPAINKGFSMGYTRDIQEKQVSRTSPDIGAFEY